MKNKVLIPLLAFVLVVVGVVTYNATDESSLLQGTTNLDSLELSGDLDVTGTTTFSGGFIMDSLITDGYSTLGTSATTSTLTETLLSKPVLLITPTTASTLALTLPASSTLSTILPSTGSSASVYVYNQTATTSVISFTGGTGNSLVKASSTASISAGGVASLTMIRKANTDVVTLLDIGQ